MKSISSEEKWLQDSEARLESMQIILNSVRRDIDVLSTQMPKSTTIVGNELSDLVLSTDAVSKDELEPRLSENFKGTLQTENGISPLNSANDQQVYNQVLRDQSLFEPLVDTEEEDEYDDNSNDGLKPSVDIHDMIWGNWKNDLFELKRWQSPTKFNISSFLNEAETQNVSTFCSNESERYETFSLDTFQRNDQFKSAFQNNESKEMTMTALYGSSLSLQTIEENSEEDRSITDSESAELSARENVSDGAVCILPKGDKMHDQLAKSRNSLERSASTEELSTVHKTSLNSVRQNENQCNERPRSGNQLVSKVLPLGSTEVSRGPSTQSLQSRESLISDADSYVTVRSQILPSSSCDDSYVTACSDSLELGSSTASEGDSVDDAMTVKFTAPNDSDKMLQLREFTAGKHTKSTGAKRKKRLILQKIQSSTSQNSTDDVLEFTLVEAAVDAGLNSPDPEITSPDLLNANDYTDENGAKEDRTPSRNNSFTAAVISSGR